MHPLVSIGSTENIDSEAENGNLSKKARLDVQDDTPETLPGEVLDRSLSTSGQNDDESNTGITIEEIQKVASLEICRLVADVSLPQSKIAQVIKLCETVVEMTSQHSRESTSRFLQNLNVNIDNETTVKFLNTLRYPDILKKYLPIPSKPSIYKN